jgi:hydroxypyruvate reductase
MVIASGPTIARVPEPDAALAVLDSYQLRHRVPDAVAAILDDIEDERADIDLRVNHFVVTGDNDLFIEAVAESAEQDGAIVSTALRLAEGEARDLAHRFVETIQDVPDEVDVVIGGGEATVTVRGEGMGGRNTEFALAAAMLLDERELDWMVASLASDGQDGLVDAAGAIVDRHTIALGRELGLDAQDSLENNDSGEFFRRLGLLVEPGPTGTNVNDVYIAMRTAHVADAAVQD